MSSDEKIVLTCPECGKRYGVKASAIPPEGRTVRCANCGNSWHSEGVAPATPPESAPTEPPPASQDAYEEEFAAPPAVDHDVAPTVPEVPPRSDDAIAREAERQAAVQEQVIAQRTVSDGRVETVEVEDDVHDIGFTGATIDDDDRPVYPEDDEEEPRGSSKRGWLWLLVALVLAAAVAVAVAFFGPDQMRPQIGTADAADAGVDTPLHVMVEERFRSAPLGSGEILQVRGRIINSTDEDQPVPPIEARLFDGEGGEVLRWQIDPPAEKLAAGESAGFHSLKRDVPRRAAQMQVRFTAPTA